MLFVIPNHDESGNSDKKKSASLLTVLLLMSGISSMQIAVFEVVATINDQDADGLPYGIEFLINTQPQDWDSDNDGLPDGWEWQYGLDPLSSTGDNGSTGDPDSDGLTNLNEYLFGIPSGWDEPSTTNILDNGVWWNGTVPVSNWDEESAMQVIQGTGSDGADEDPVGNICTDTFDNDHDGMVDSNDDDFDGDADCASNDDDGDGIADEDPNGWDTDGDGMPDGWEAANGLDPTSNSNQDGTFGDPDSDGLSNIYEYVNPAWGTRNGSTFPPTQYFRPGPINMTATESPCNPVLSLGPGGCVIFTAEVDGITQTDPQNNDTDGDGLNDSLEALVLLTDPTSQDTDSDGIFDGIEFNGSYGDPAQGSDPRNNNTDGDHLDDGDEDLNGNGVIDPGETDPTRINDEGDFDGDGLQNWEENNSCTLWNVSDSDGGGINDGDEGFPGQTDPCTSIFELVFSIVSWDGDADTLTLNSTDGINPDPVDWRGNPPMAYFVSPNGTRTSFSYDSLEDPFMRGVDTEPPTGANTILFTNGSWCWDASPNATNDPWCDDDYKDTDGDGLADWEELTATWGFLSDPTLSDTDGDGVNDLSETLNLTDPREPCHNLLDSDEDGLNNYFENTTGCSMIFGIGGFGFGGNFTTDVWFTLWNVADSDNGGVEDGQEYLDGTNPQDNPDDDINPLDTDGDGIPDLIEQELGLDWLDPDSDGGGVPDGEECPEEFWSLDCLGSPSDPFDPLDDIQENSLMFTATNTSEGLDPTVKHYWRWHTYDYYTGVSWGVNSTLVGNTQVTPEFSTDQGVADQSFWNHSGALSWEILFEQAGYIGPGQELIQPFNVVNYTTWVDISAGLNFSNYTRDIIVDSAVVEALYVNAPEVILATEIRENTTAFANSDYGKELPQDFLDNSGFVINLTQDVLDASGAISAWDKVSAIQDFIVNGNDTFSFLRNHHGSGRVDGLGNDSDITHWVLNSSREGSCDEFTSVFVTMLRIAGIPARKVTGFSGGSWDGKAFKVYGKDFSRWAEVHLQTNQNQGELDLGWIPFEACPPMSEVSVNVESWGPTSVERNTTISETIWVEGTLEFVENNTLVDNISLSMYLVETSLTGEVPGSAATQEHMVANVTTDTNGAFNLTGLPPQIIQPGFGSLVILTTEKGYVGTQGISMPWQVNITDNVSISISSPIPTEQPMLGIGVNSSITGQLSWASSPYLDPSITDDLQIVLNYSSSVDGEVSIVSGVSGGGYYEFIVPIDEIEPLGLMDATVSFQGWHFTDLNNGTPPSYHARPGSHSFQFNITLSPNLSVELESQGTNNSILEIGNNIYLNGTVLSRGPSPTPLNGTLILEMRRADISGPFVELSSWYLNNSSWGATPGDFSVSWPFSATDVPLPAGPVDVRLQFDSDNLNSNDQEQFVDIFGIRSFVVFDYELPPSIRGREYAVDVFMEDHTGSSFASFQGDYTLLFDGDVVWNESDPDAGRVTPTFTPMNTLEPGDYVWNLSYGGSTWLSPNTTTGVVRVRGIANATASLSDEWSVRGSMNWVSGIARDMVLLSQITGNNSSVLVQLLIPSDLPPTPGGFPASPTIYNIASGWVNETTGAYNLSFEIPSGVPSGVYEIDVTLSFSGNPPMGSSYYNAGEPTTIPVGVQTEFVVQTDPQASIVTAGEQLTLQSVVTDVEDPSAKLSGVALDLYFDWGGPLEDLLQSGITDSEGLVSFDPIIPASAPPGFYDIRIHAPDDITDSLSTQNAGRWLGNESFMNLTVQVASTIDISSIPTQVTALQYFTLVGTVMDSADLNRTVEGPVGINVFFLDEPDELLIENHTTNMSGGFNVSVPTDTLGNGVLRGDRTVVVSVVNGSTPFYLTGNGDASILVVGVSQFIDTNPFVNTIVDRGNSAIMTTRLIEFSNNEAPLSGFEVFVRFHDTWLDPEVTASDGSVAFEFDIPHDHPLGLVNVTFVFNGSEDLHQAVQILNTITIRSSTTMVIDPITANPLPGEFFNVTGSLTSSNGTGLSDTSGNPLNPTLTFSIDAESSNFTVSQVSFHADGTWSAQLRLDLSFPRGPHGLDVSFTPQVTYFSSASGFSTFDSRGYSVLTIESPNDLDPDNRTIRGETFDIDLSIMDNSGEPVSSATIVVRIDNITVWGGLTDSNGSASATILVRPDRDPGPMVVTATFSGINGTIGLLGDETWTRVVVLAPTELVLKEASSPSIAGESVTLVGSLLDERDQLLMEDGSLSGGLIHLYIDGIDVGPAYTTFSNASTGQWSITYLIPADMDFGAHLARIDFLGGFSWVDPMGQGDSLNPEYYLPSSDSMVFNVTQPSQVIISTSPADIDRTEVAIVEGMLTDGVGRAIPNREISLSVNGQDLTGLSVDENGSFTGFVPIAPDMPLGPMLIEVEFAGEDFILPSNSSVVFTVYAPVFVAMDSIGPVAVGDVMVISGSVKDNLEDGWLGSQTIEIFVDGILAGITSSQDNGNWSLEWEIPESMDVGNHSISAISPAQGFYRQSSAESNFTVSYHTSISLQVEQTYVTRGGHWNFTGRLFESDTGFELGLEGREISVLLDGVSLESISTEEGGVFSFTHRVQYSLSRGAHNISFQYDGEFLYLPTEAISPVFALSDVVVEILPITNTIVRGDESPSNSIMIQGLIRELGGESAIFANLSMSLTWGDSNLPIALGPWDNPSTMNFQIRAKAQEFMHPGENVITIVVDSDQTRFLNGAYKEIEILVMVEVDFVYSEIDLSNGQRVIRGTVNATARDTGAPLEGLSLTASLVNGTTTHFSVSKLTGADGVFEYEFKSMAPLPALSEQSLPPEGWGLLSVMLGSESEFIDPGSLALLPSSGVSIAYEQPEGKSFFESSAMGIGVLVVAAIAIALGAFAFNTKRKSTIRELAKVLGQTVEMLASGDEYRRAIFLCYENLCSVLMRRGFLRRNFETVREFEFAIREALPISEASLISLDRIFEEARYSSHVLGDSHRDNAQLALSSVMQEIEAMKEIPKRDLLQIEMDE
ncbi:MAG TPA: transglutaminase domain-containing protein [Candidatus Thalassarchaeaceae archaeon]|nr:transglutaminase domain-containing protein [Candidatus Thalassarchaeaceae archaeon]